MKRIILLFFALSLFGCLGPSQAGGGTSTNINISFIKNYSDVVSTEMTMRCQVSTGNNTRTAYVKGLKSDRIFFFQLTPEESDRMLTQYGQTCDWMVSYESFFLGYTDVDTNSRIPFRNPGATWTCVPATLSGGKFGFNNICSISNYFE